MNNTLKYLLICLAATTTPLFANACINAGGDPESCQTYCETQENYITCMEGATPPNPDDSNISMTEQTEQPAS